MFNILFVFFVDSVRIVRNYVRKLHRQSWSMDRLQAAVDDIKANKLSLRKAAAVYGVPHVTIHRYLLGLVQKPSRLGQFQTVLDDKFEQELAMYVTDMQQRFYGLSSIQLKRLAFDLAVKNGISHPFNAQNGRAGKDWMTGFIRRHPNISFRYTTLTKRA